MYLNLLLFFCLGFSIYRVTVENIRITKVTLYSHCLLMDLCRETCCEVLVSTTLPLDYPVTRVRLFLIEIFECAAKNGIRGTEFLTPHNVTFSTYA